MLASISAEYCTLSAFNSENAPSGTTYTDRMARRRPFRKLAGLDVDLHVIKGPPNVRPFVLVHGIGVSSRYFGPMAKELSKHGTVYAVDLPGYGTAPDPRRDVELADHGAVISELVRELGLVNPVLVGHSMGTQIVTQLAVDDPTLTDRLVLMGTTMPPHLRTVPRASFALFKDILREPAHCNLVVMVDYFFRCGIPYYLRQLPKLLDDRIEDRLGDIRAKTLVIAGDRDPIAGDGWSLRVANTIPDGSFAEVEGAHVVMFTDPARVAALIADHSR